MKRAELSGIASSSNALRTFVLGLKSLRSAQYSPPLAAGSPEFGVAVVIFEEVLIAWAWAERATKEYRGAGGSGFRLDCGIRREEAGAGVRAGSGDISGADVIQAIRGAERDIMPEVRAAETNRSPPPCKQGNAKKDTRIRDESATNSIFAIVRIPALCVHAETMSQKYNRFGTDLEVSGRCGEQRRPRGPGRAAAL